MKKLIKGLREFRANYVSTHRELLEQLSHGQKPRVLFITCSDSRIDPNLLTQTDVGELFVIRNAGNIIPPYGAANGGEGASVEYAIHALGIEQIVVCGHSHCGAMKGLLQLGKLEEQMPLVYDWLKHAEATRRLVLDNYSHYDSEELLEVTIAENVLTQIENLKTYPVVHSRLYQNKLKIYGWIYLIETGEVLAYDPESHAYLPPQSQLPEYELEEGPPRGQYRKTHAPPVACSLPFAESAEPVISGPDALRESEAASEPLEIRSKAAAPNGRNTKPANAPNRDQADLTPLWLSPEQAERIYRGSTSTAKR
ncbi:carbonic anhydrase [Leptolyngbya sp. NK1-12]|uniref:Carbonic anhydrase n=1 Tax=Leptolyngbya sp. NK1-12 TaxID=2547451 RepID=A0AA96WD44_9CYAN|nr:carbonic anhydrase [Leptolyngbya sp. NK1-12]WNZ22873.1 carbonic anhydrase [Leptolyngbya sp. NK1-12]